MSDCPPYDRAAREERDRRSRGTAGSAPTPRGTILISSLTDEERQEAERQFHEEAAREGEGEGEE